MKVATLIQYFIFFCVYFSSGISTYAQQLDTLLPPLDPRYLSALSDTCHVPKLLENTVIQFDGYSKAYLRFLDPPNTTIYYRLGTKGVFTQSQLQDGRSILLPNLAPNNTYEIWINDNCGRLSLVTVVNTQRGEQEQVTVSEAFYNAMVRHAKMGMGSMPFWDYLKGQNDVSAYEKILYAQQFYLKGAPVISDNPEDFSPPTLDSCRCKWYLNPTQSVSLGTQVPNVPADNAGVIIEHTNSLPKTEVASYAAYWGINNNKGPAKYHQLWMEGFKAPKNQLHVRNWSHLGSNTAGSTQFAKLRVNLHCQNDQDPESCQCRKLYRFYYRYDTEVAAHTHLVDGGGGDKKAVAAVEDAAVVTFKNEATDERELIAAGRARAKSECEHLVNDEFWLSWIEFARIVANVILDTSTIDTNDINQLAASLSTLVTTDHYISSTCSTADTVANLFEDFKNKQLVANQPIEVRLYSFNHLLAGGMRSWHSWARANSDFYLMGYIPGGNQQGESSNCCMAQFAHWVLGSIDGPLSTSDVKEEVGELMYTYYPWDIPIDPAGGSVILPGEYGWTSKSVPQDCHYIVIGGDERSNDAGALADSPVLNGSGRLRLFDVKGRLVMEREYSENSLDVRTFIQGAGFRETPGLYFLQINNGTSIKGYKILLK